MGYSPTQRLTNAQSAYNADLALAQQGNLDALNRITSSADALIQAGRDMYGSGSQFVALRDQIIAQLTALPAVQSADQQIIDQLSGVNTRLDTANTRINTTNSAISTSVINTTATAAPKGQLPWLPLNCSSIRLPII